jgi:cytochrome c-550 PedF
MVYGMNNMKTMLIRIFSVMVFVSSSVVFAHGDVSPQPVDIAGLEKIDGKEWLEVNPYRGSKQAAIIGSSAYNQNCARCHGLQAVSGGVAPDLRELPWGEEGDVFYVDRMKNGAIRNGITYMPAFDGIVSQEGLWAIRSYLDDLSLEKPEGFVLK